MSKLRTMHFMNEVIAGDQESNDVICSQRKTIENIISKTSDLNGEHLLEKKSVHDCVNINFL